MHPALRISGAIALAVALVGGALFAIDRSATDRATPDNAKPADSQATAHNPASVTPPTTTPAVAALADNPQPVTPQRSSEPVLEHVGTIAKCRIDGKIVYTDKGCPRGSSGESLQITDNAIIPGYDRATVENTLRQPPPPVAQAAPPGSVIEPITSIGTESGVDCTALGRRFEWLDYNYNRARHWQAPHIRDRMRRERDEVQTRMFWGHC